MAVLHIVNKSPYERNALDACLRLSRQGSAILLIEDGIYAAQKNSTAAAKLGEVGERKVYVLQPDLDARGIRADQLLDGVSPVDYDGFVNLTTEYDRVQSWL